MKKLRLKELLAEYGQVALWIYLAIFALVLVGFMFAIKLGVKLEGTAGELGIWGAAWVATKLTQPLRIGATVVLTPFVAHVLRVRRRPRDQVPVAANDDASTP